MGEIAEFLESKAVAKKIVEDRKKLPDGFLDEEARRVKIGVWVRDLLEKQISKYIISQFVRKIRTKRIGLNRAISFLTFHQ